MEVTLLSDRIIVTQRGGGTTLLGRYMDSCRYSTNGGTPPGDPTPYYTVSIYFDAGKGPMNLATGVRDDVFTIDLREVEKTSQPSWSNTEQGAQNAILDITPILRAEECCGTPGAVIAANAANCQNLFDPTWGLTQAQLTDCVIPGIDFCGPTYKDALTPEQLACICECDPLTATLNGVEIINEAEPCGADIALECDDLVDAVVVEGAGTANANGLYKRGADINGFPAYYADNGALLSKIEDDGGAWELNFDGNTLYGQDDGIPVEFPWQVGSWSTTIFGEEPTPTVRQATIADLCPCAECEDVTIQLRDSAANNIGAPDVYPAGTTTTKTAPDGTVNVRNLNGTTLGSPTVRSNASTNYNAPIPLKFALAAGGDTSITWTVTDDEAGTYGTYTQDGSSGTLTYSLNGGAFAALSGAIVLAVADTIAVKRTTFTSAGFIKWAP